MVREGFAGVALLMTIAEAAESLRLSPRKVTMYIASGDLPVVRFGGAVRVDSTDLAAFVEAHKCSGVRAGGAGFNGSVALA